DISTQLINITQGNRTAAEYPLKFRTLTAQSGWNDIALKAIFYNSLNAKLQTELTCHREDSSFSEMVTIAVRIDNLMRQTPKRKINKVSPRNSTVTASSATHSHDGPMQLKRKRNGETPTKSSVLLLRMPAQNQDLLWVMIDSGAALNLIHKDIVSKYNIPT
ncbi:hypothetical protein M9458_048998, partial [Cirrhinus mrigala]